MSFEYDIFISNAEAKSAVSDNQDTWAKRLRYFLHLVLDRLLGERPTIALSEDLEKNYLTVVPADFFARTAIFVSVLSPESIKSSKALKELELIYPYLKTSISLHTDSQRFFKVLKSNLTIDEQPEKVRTYLSYDFYDVNLDTGQVREFEQLFGNESEKYYWFKLIDLAYDIYEALIELRSDHYQLPENYHKRTVFLAETGTDLKTERENIRRELRRHGCKIVPDKPLATDLQQLEKQVLNDLENSYLSVHLIGSDFGLKTCGYDVSLGEIQNRWAADFYNKLKRYGSQKRNTDFSRLIWLSPDIKRLTEAQKILIEQLKRDSDVLHGAEVVQTPVETFKSLILQKLSIQKELAPKDIRFASETSSKRTIYLIFDKRNNAEVEKVIQWLETQNYEVISSYNKDRQQISLTSHRRNLVNCDSVIIFTTSMTDNWVNIKLQDIIKAPGYGRQKDWRSKTVITTKKTNELESVCTKYQFKLIDYLEYKTL